MKHYSTTAKADGIARTVFLLSNEFFNMQGTHYFLPTQSQKGENHLKIAAQCISDLATTGIKPRPSAQQAGQTHRCTSSLRFKTCSHTRRSKNFKGLHDGRKGALKKCLFIFGCIRTKEVISTGKVKT